MRAADPPAILRRSFTAGSWKGDRRTYTLKLDAELRPTDKGQELSICGTLWDSRVRGDCISTGQNRDDLRRLLAQPGATLKLPRAMLERLASIWDTWHLNGMRAGCAHQREAKWEERPIDPSKPLDSYGLHYRGQTQTSWNMLTWVPRKEHPHGLLSEPCPECGYRFGTAWLHEALPDDVVAFIRALPWA